MKNGCDSAATARGSGLTCGWIALCYNGVAIIRE